MNRISLMLTTIAALLILAPDPQAIKVQGPDTLGNVLPIQITPPGATGLTVTNTGATSTGGAQANNVNLAAVGGVTNYCTGFEVTGGGATAGSEITVTLSGVTGGPWNYTLSVATGATALTQPLIVEFTTPVSATTTNTAITLAVPSFGVGNTNASAVIHGFRQ